MRSTPALLSALSLALAACGSTAGDDPAHNAAKNAAAPEINASAAVPQERVLRTETVSGTFTGWEMGDYLWAQIEVPGREPVAAQPGPTPIDLFLDAHRGQMVTVDVATILADVPEAGGATEVQRITGARNAATTADAWWADLPEAERQAAQRRFEEGALSGR